MKKVEVEKLVGKSIIITAILLVVILGITTIEEGYIDALNYPKAKLATVIISIACAILAAILVGISVVSNKKYYTYASISAITAILLMLIKVDHDVFSVGIPVNTRTIKFYYIAVAILCALILATWVKATTKLIKG